MIAVNAVERTIGGRTLFRDVSLTIGPGSRTALVGANGAGKTTLLDIVAGNQQPDAGEVQRPRGTTVGFLRQDVASWAAESVGRGREHSATVLEAVVAASAADAVRQERDALLPRLEDLDDPQHEALLAQYGEAAAPLRGRSVGTPGVRGPARARRPGVRRRRRRDPRLSDCSRAAG